MAVDPRTTRLQQVWGRGGAAAPFEFTTDPDKARSWSRGLTFCLRAKAGEGAEIPVRADGRLLSQTKGELLGYAWNIRGPGMQPMPLNRQLGYAYRVLDLTAGAHSDVLTVTQGNHTVQLNQAAGGYIDSWQVSGTEILNRGDVWKRGMFGMASWADADLGWITKHTMVQGSDRFSSGTPAHGAPLINARSYVHPSGGTVVEAAFIPIEADPDGQFGVLGCRSDHGGGEGNPVIWDRIPARMQLWLDFEGTADLHRVTFSADYNAAIQSGWFDVAQSIVMYLDGAFNSTLIRDSNLGSNTDVTAAMNAVEARRFAHSRSGAYQDNVASPSSASVIASGHGGWIANNTGESLAVGLGGRLHAISAGTDLSIADYPRGTTLTGGTVRAGSNGHDQGNFVLFGLDSNLTTRWHSKDGIRRIPKGLVETKAWIATGTLAAVQTLMDGIPSSY